MERDTLLINKSLIPYDFNIALGLEEFTLRIDYNNTGRFFTVELKKNGATLCSGEPIIYGRKLFKDVWNTNFPSVDIAVYDLSEEAIAVSYDNLNEKVLLIIDNQKTPVLKYDY